jgi:hypothetical protein
MGRKSSLTPDQWLEIERRALVNNESVNSLAKEFGIDEAAIRRKINPNKSESKKRISPLKELANEKFQADLKLKDISERIAVLPYAKQQIVFDLSARLNNISGHLAGAAEFGAATAHRLSGIAHGKVIEMDDSSPLNEESMESLKGIAVLTKMANESSQIGINLLAANKEFIKDQNSGSNQTKDELMKELVSYLPD